MRPIRNRVKPPLCGRAPSTRRADSGPAGSFPFVAWWVMLRALSRPRLPVRTSVRPPRLLERRLVKERSRPPGVEGQHKWPQRPWGTAWARSLVGRSMHVSASVCAGKLMCACSSHLLSMAKTCAPRGLIRPTERVSRWSRIMLGRAWLALALALNAHSLICKGSQTALRPPFL